MFKLSYINPTKSVIVYKVIQSNSAVSNKCNEVLVLTKTLKKIKKKKKNSKFKVSIIIFDTFKKKR